MSTNKAQREFLNSVRALSNVLWTATRSTPRLAVGALVLAPLAQAVPPLQALWLKVIADGMLSSNVSQALFGGGLVAATAFFQILVAGEALRIRLTVTERVGFELDLRMAQIAGALPGLEHFEQPEFQNKLELLRQERGQLGATMHYLSMTFTAVLRLIISTFLLASLHPYLIALPLLGVISVVSAKGNQRRLRIVEDENAELLRLAQHLFRLGIDPAAGKELRVFNAERNLAQRYGETRREHAYRMMRVHWLNAVFNGIASIIVSLGLVGSILFIGFLAVGGEATVGDVLLGVILSSQVSGIVGEVVWSARYLLGTARTAERFLWLQEFQSTVIPRPASAGPPVRIEQGIRLEDVWFRYPGNSSWAIQQANLILPPGSVVALVGENGAGKTTLVKLLCRLYQPSKGAVTLDGIDITDFDVLEWRRRLATAFQDFAKFQFLARETVGVGDLPRLDDVAAVEKALRKAQATEVVTSLPKGLNTQVGSMFEGGIDLSSGQWQKFALSRAMMRESPLLLIMDEPTASLDAESEYRLFERYAEAAHRAAVHNGAITVLVSHRFSSVRMADLIVVLERGRVSETGSHESLMADRGLYSEMYSLQARGYR